MMACQEAVDHFTEIVRIIGGEGEKIRAKELVSRLTIVPGQDTFQVGLFCLVVLSVLMLEYVK